PRRIGDWYIVVRLEKFFPAQLDEAMEQRLMDELFQQWLKGQLQGAAIQTPSSDMVSVQTKANSDIDKQDVNFASGANREVLAHPEAFAKGGVAPGKATTERNPFKDVLLSADEAPEKSDSDPWS
ncbi:MAG: hypothetical protein F6K42_38600, partial [Leptolyngbya sp. SIO1D8]|nr:hypothetical protein [Leptolyngbya sp. SIO1D8]